MHIGVPTEIKPQEKRVGLTPESVGVLIGDGHSVVVRRGLAQELAPTMPPIKPLARALRPAAMPSLPRQT